MGEERLVRQVFEYRETGEIKRGTTQKALKGWSQQCYRKKDDFRGLIPRVALHRKVLNIK